MRTVMRPVHSTLTISRRKWRILPARPRAALAMGHCVLALAAWLVPGEETVAGPPADLTGPAFRVGVAARDITPGRPVPLWGYGARHDALSAGTLVPLTAKAVVIEAGGAKLAIVGLDLGRGPTSPMMKQIREAVAAAGITQVLACGSHTHHGPVIELTDRPGFGRGKFDDAVAYAEALPGRIIEAILEADARREPARIGVAARDLALNRNRHTKRAERPTDPRLTVIRFDRHDGSPIAILAHYTAHPVLTDEKLLKFSADYPGSLRETVERALKAPCVFLQGAAGDQSANPPPGSRDPRDYGRLLGEHVVQLARGLATATPARPSLACRVDAFSFPSRVNVRNPLTFVLYAQAFFPELIRNFFQELEHGVKPELSTTVLNGDLALVGLSGEPFCEHAVRLRRRAEIPHVLVLGYCNGHQLYFPTIEAAAEGGYGADARVSPIAIGGGEAMVDRALINIYRLTGKLAGEPVAGE